MKQTYLGVAVGISLLAAGCSTGNATQGQSGDAVKSKDVALVLGVKGSPFYEAMACGAKAKAKTLGLNLTVSAGEQFAADAQVPVVNAVTAKRPAVAAVVPTDASALVQPLTQLTRAGTMLITVDQTVADDSLPKTKILTDNLKGGQLAAQEMNKLLGGKGKVLVITQPPGSTAQDERTKGFVDGLKAFPGLDYLGEQYQSDDPQKAAQIVTSTIAAHPDLAGIFSTNDQGAIGALTGLKQAKATGKVNLIAYDAASAEVAALKNGTIAALIAQNPKQEGEVAMETAQKLIDGETVEKQILTDLVVIDKTNLDQADKYEYAGDC
jgi:ribose transport system substrate-binding protein